VKRDKVSNASERSCQGIKSDGSKCKNIAIDGEIYCHAHHPDRKEARIENGRIGGLCPRRPDLPECEELTNKQSHQLLAAAAEKLIQGKLSANVARSLGYLLQTDIRLTEHEDLMARIEQLEGKKKAKSKDVSEISKLKFHGL
jgi:hypothetical protein